MAIYISYATAEAPLAEQVQDRLLSHGAPVWRPTRDGDVLSDRRDGVLSAQPFLALLSRSYLGSAVGRTEYRLAQEHGVPIVAVFSDLDPAVAMELGLDPSQTAVSLDKGIEGLFAVPMISELCGATPLPAPPINWGAPRRRWWPARRRSSVFISHASEDARDAAEIRAALRAEGMTCREIRAGGSRNDQERRRKIADAVDRSEVFLVVDSDAYERSLAALDAYAYARGRRADRMLHVRFRSKRETLRGGGRPWVNCIGENRDVGLRELAMRVREILAAPPAR